MQSTPRITIDKDQFGRYKPVLTQKQIDSDELSSLEILSRCFSGDTFACAQWYQQFALAPEATEMDNSTLRFIKHEGKITIRYRLNYPPHFSDHAVVIDTQEFIKALDTWCELVENNAPKVLLTFDGTHITLEELTVQENSYDNR